LTPVFTALAQDLWPTAAWTDESAPQGSTALALEKPFSKLKVSF